jgi:GT2 family glycosyltransferase
MAQQPEVSVVVPTHNRALRLLWLLNALEEQTLPRERWELVVVHDSTDETAEVLRTHPLAEAGVLRDVRLEPGTGTASRQRNTGWRAARADTIAFTDDDTRPEPDWLENILAAARRNPSAIVQGRTKPDPFEAEIMEFAPRPRSIDEDDPPGPHAQTCNILYPRAALEEVDGFDESIATAGEDWDLKLRAEKAGYGYVGEPRALVYHACDEFSLPKAITFNKRWQTLPKVLKRHPEQRAILHRRLFWKHTHLWLPPAVAGVLLHRREPLFLLLAAPYVLYSLPHHGTHPLGRLRAAFELAGRAAVDASEIAAMVSGSVRYRTVML